MRFDDIVSFRRDLLFDGAVQISWLENNKELAIKAAEHYVFHGPDYHGITQDDIVGREYLLQDTATFTLDVLKRVNGLTTGDPFTLAIAGYGAGKSHLGITLSSLLSDPGSNVAGKILKNMALADEDIGIQSKQILQKEGKPFIVVTINGMKDFNLCGEIMRQIILVLNQSNLDTSVLKNLRPRFEFAAKFTESFYSVLEGEFAKSFGASTNGDEIIGLLENQDEDVFKKVNSIFEQQMGNAIPATGKEALHEFITVAKDNFCGLGKPFSGMVILFDEFGRYLEFSVQSPHIAGSGALQQLFEAVQENSDSVFFIGFIQYEPKAYISRIAPELHEDLNRYVSRYDMARKVHLSSNLETLIANLFEKKNYSELENQLLAIPDSPEEIQALMLRWFPDVGNHALWTDLQQFKQVIVQGCWPLHPFSTWVLYKLSSVGKSFQQRSAFSFLADAFDLYKETKCAPGQLILPVDLCSDAMLGEFLISEQYRQQGAIAHAYYSVVDKYRHELSREQNVLLKAVLLLSKVGYKVESKEECLHVLALFSGVGQNRVEQEVRHLESDLAVLEWNDSQFRFEIAEDSVPKRAFIAYVKRESEQIDSGSRAEIFGNNYAKWSGVKEFNTDFGIQNKISTREWRYSVSFASVSQLKRQIEHVLRIWMDCRGADEAKGQLIYCYVGPESNIDDVKGFAEGILEKSLRGIGIDWGLGVPIAIILLHDVDGSFGQNIAENWVLIEMDKEARLKFDKFISDHQNSLKQTMETRFSKMKMAKYIVVATGKTVDKTDIKVLLTNLFSVIYDQYIPFPFDGFHTARGHAARDCQLFTRQLLLGRLDKEWIAAQGQQQRNRAHSVLVDSWGILGEDGSIRLRPKNERVSKIIALLDSKLPLVNKGNAGKVVNLGSIIRLLCAPPYGCNLSSAGLLLALFIGKRKSKIIIVMNEEIIGYEHWLQEALGDRYFELPILDLSFIKRVDEDSLSEWEALFEDWEGEEQLLSKYHYLSKAEKLQGRVTVPPQLHYRLARLQEQSDNAFKKIKDHDEKIDGALKKINEGLESNDIGKLSHGGTDLVKVLEKMNEQRKLWTDYQIEEIEDHIKKVRKHIVRIFDRWLAQLVVTGIEQLNQFKDINSQIADNLQRLNLPEKQKLLNDHVEQISSNIKEITQINRVVSDVNSMVGRNYITDSTPVSVINVCLRQVEEFEKRLELAADKVYLWNTGIEEAVKTLTNYKQQCVKQLEIYTGRMRKIFDIQNLSDSSHIGFWREEIAALKVIYEGYEKDLEDLDQVLKHLNLIEQHIGVLSDYNLSVEEFAAACESCMEETEKYFSDDAPPLDHESIYIYLKGKIEKDRTLAANEWFLRNMPDIKGIKTINANDALQLKSVLLPIPKVLSEDQKVIVQKAVDACEKRLDELEVEGLIARFKVLSKSNKEIFLELAFKYLD